MNDERMMDADEPVYVISIAARIVGVHQQTLRMYERQRLVADLGVNLAGAEVILRMNERMQQMEQEMEALREEVRRRGGRGLPSPDGRTG
jgi:MerR family transcriptional regulator/heat shock protein HspR